jgi:subtilisin-like proprotein convertase family protein
VLPQASGIHTLYVSLNAGAGVRLYVRDTWGMDELLINHWNTTLTNAVELSADIDLVAGSASNLRLEYKNPSGSPRVTLSWSWPGQGKTVIPRGRFVLGGLQPTGVAVAADGKIWTSCLGTHNLMRIDPQGGPMVGSNRLGAIDMVVDLGNGGFHTGLYTNLAASPYNYSDMTGFNNRIVNPSGQPLQGWWRVVEDGQVPRRRWTTVSWNPTGTGVLVAVRALDDRAALVNQPFVIVTNGLALSGVRGRFLEIRVALRRETTSALPVLNDLTVRGESSGLSGTLTLPNVTAYEGTDAVFVPDAIGAQPMTWEWTVQPPWAMGPTTFFGGPTLTVTNVDHYDDQTWASVLVTEASGDSIFLGPATLTVVPTPIVIPATGTLGIASRYPATITVEGQSAGANGVTVYLDGLSHAKPDDLDILLVTPLGKKIMLMSDAGGTNPVTNATLGFHPGTDNPPPDSGPIPSNLQIEYTASNYEPGEVLPSPAPAGPYTNTLQSVLADAPNGQWKLYLHDDSTNGSGTLSRSWKIIFY